MKLNFQTVLCQVALAFDYLAGTVLASLPIANYKILLIFKIGEKRLFDMNPFLDKGIFQELRDYRLPGFLTEFNQDVSFYIGTQSHTFRYSS